MNECYLQSSDREVKVGYLNWPSWSSKARQSTAKTTEVSPLYTMVRFSPSQIEKETIIKWLSAAVSNRLDCVKSLIAAGAKVNFQYGTSQDSLLHTAVKSANLDLLEILLR